MGMGLYNRPAPDDAVEVLAEARNIRGPRSGLNIVDARRSEYSIHAVIRPPIDMDTYMCELIHIRE